MTRRLRPMRPRTRATLLSGLGFVALLCGCQGPPGPIFPPVAASLVWPPPPDIPRIRYIGELRGEANLGAQPKGWAAVQAVLAGPPPQAAFSRPAAIAVHGERVFVADTGVAVVHMLDLEQRRYAALRGAPHDPLRVPIALAIAEPSTLVVVDRGRAALDIFDLDGNWRATRHWPQLAAPNAVAWDADHRRFWIADSEAHACFTAPADWSDLELHLGGRGSAPGQFNFPTAIAYRPPFGLVVADAMNFRVQFFDPAGTPRAVFGQKGDAAGDFARPRAVAVDSEGHIYVLDNQFENIQVFDRAGQLLMAFGQGGSGPGEFALPSGLTIDEKDRIWVADSSNRRVQVFQYLAEKTACAAAL